MGTAERSSVEVADGALTLALHLPDCVERAPCVIACHGLNASKDSDKYLQLGAEMPAAGLALARFDFRGCGESSGREADTTIATRRGRRGRVGPSGEPSAFRRPLRALGSSLGGFVALFVAARRPGTPVVTWNAPASLGDLADDGLAESRGLGVPFAVEYATGRYALAPGGMPWHLVVHGDADDVVPLDHGCTLHAQAAEPCDFVVIEGGDHRLTDPEHRARAVALSRDWFLSRFKGDAR